MKMNQRTSVFVLFGSLACGLAVLAVTLHAATQTAGGTLALTEGVRIMRLVGSAEVSLAAGRDSPARYRALTEVLASPDAASFKGDVTVIDGETGSFKGYRMRITAQGGRYEASLIPDKGCGLAFFVDEKNVIYVGRGLGCDEK